MTAIPRLQPILTLDNSIESEQLVEIRNNLSAIVLLADHLWLGGDEGTLVERLTRDAYGNFANHRRFDLASLLDLPVPGAKSEIDLEGMDVDGGYLWLIGSHSLKRKKPEKDKTAEKNRLRLADVSGDGNRYTLARVPLNESVEPVRQVGALSAARLQGDATGDLLSAALLADRQFAPFCVIPSKDNGVDVEGLAVRGNRAFAGLRGPVLRGWSVILDMELNESGAGLLGFVSPVRKHFLQLEGLGVRDLAIAGSDLYILAGPSMDLDGPVCLFRWKGALDQASDALVWAEELEKLLEVPYGTGSNRGRDHAEGITLTAAQGGLLSVLICYDSPAAARMHGPDKVRVDLFDLKGASPQ